jgi:hypothetical protein
VATGGPVMEVRRLTSSVPLFLSPAGLQLFIRLKISDEYLSFRKK